MSALKRSSVEHNSMHPYHWREGKVAELTWPRRLAHLALEMRERFQISTVPPRRQAIQSPPRCAWLTGWCGVPLRYAALDNLHKPRTPLEGRAGKQLLSTLAETPGEMSCHKSELT